MLLKVFALMLLVSPVQVISRAWADGLRPPEDVAISKWCQDHVKLVPPDPEPGPWHNERTPYLVQIMDCLSPFSAARDITFMKGVQIGGTQAALNVIACRCAVAPTSILLVLPTEKIANEWSDFRLRRVFESTPELESLLSDGRNRRGGGANRRDFKDIRGGLGVIKVAWSSSASTMRSTPAELVFADEVDAFVGDTQGEGDPVQLLTNRIQNFPRGKFLKISSPTAEHQSRIARDFARGDQRYYFLPCPECGHFQHLIFERLKWPEGQPDKVLYECQGCRHGIGEYHKTEMLRLGRWVATADHPDLLATGFPRVDLELLKDIFEQMSKERFVSFHLSGLYSPAGWLSWVAIAEEWEKCRHDSRAHKVFKNCKLGEVWIEGGAMPKEEKLFEQRESYERGVVPRGAYVLVCGVDVQDDRLEVELAAWGPGKERWSVDYFPIYGPTHEIGVWEELEAVLAKDYPTAYGASTPIRAMAIDSGHRAEKVYEFARKHSQPMFSQVGARIVQNRTVIVCKGKPHFDRLIASVSSDDAARKRGGLRIYSVGTGFAKNEIAGKLKLSPAADGTRFPAGFYHTPDYDFAYYQGLCSETLVTVGVGDRREWRRNPSRRNEPLDLAVLNLFAAGMCRIEYYRQDKWRELAEVLERPVLVERGIPAPAHPAAFQPKPLVADDPYLEA